MSNPLYDQMASQVPQSNMMEQIQKLKQTYKDPNQVIQQMLNSGRISQAQYNAAVQKAQGIMRMMGLK